MRVRFASKKFGVNCNLRPVKMAGAAEGATALEFAIVAPVLFLLIIGILELGLVFFTYTVLEGATNIASRIGKTGYTQGGLSRIDYIRARIEELSVGLLDPNDITITTLNYDSLANVGQPEPCISPPTPPCPGTVDVNFQDINGNLQWDSDMGRSGVGGAGAIVLYRVSYPWELFTPMMRQIIGDANGEITITAVATVRNEPF